MKDKLLRTLADMENLRERSARQIESNKQYAVQVPPHCPLLHFLPLRPRGRENLGSSDAHCSAWCKYGLVRLEPEVDPRAIPCRM